MEEGRTDQEVLELLYIENVLGARAAFVLLPALTLNSETVSIIAKQPQEQPVVHLGGHPDTLRAAVFQEAFQTFCNRSSQPGGIRDLDLREAYFKALWDEVQTPGEGISSGHYHNSAIMGCFQRLVWHLEERGRGKEALGILRKALEFAEDHFGKKHPDSLQAVSALGSALQSRGQLKEGEALLRRAYLGFKAQLGEKHRDSLISANNLGLVLEAQGQHRQAVALFRRAYAGLTAALGAEAIATVSAAFNLGSSLTAMASLGQTELIPEAEKLLRGVLQSRQRMPEERDAMLQTQQMLAALLVAAKRPLEAEALQREVVEARRSGQAAGTQLQALSILAQAVRLQGKTDEAVKLFREAYALSQEPKAASGDVTSVYAAAGNLASALMEAGHVQEAGVLFRRAKEGLERTLGKDHPNSRSARGHHGDDFLTVSLGHDEEENKVQDVLAFARLRLPRSARGTV